MIISHKNRFIFLKTQKCAGTSVEMALCTICGPDDVITNWGAEDSEIQKQLDCQPRNFLIPMEYRPKFWRLKQMAGLRNSHVGLNYFSHMPASKIRKCMDESLFDSYRKMTIVRNPWDREVSLYFWRFRNNPTPPPFSRYVWWLCSALM